MKTSRMKSFRKPVPYGTLKGATFDLVNAVGGVRNGAEHCRVGKSALSTYASELDEHDQVYMPIDVVVQLESRCGEAFVTSMLAAMQGYCLVPLPQPSEVKTIIQSCAEIAKGSGQVISNAVDAIDDRKITSKEASNIIQQVDLLIKTLVTLRGGIEHHE